MGCIHPALAASDHPPTGQNHCAEVLGVDMDLLFWWGIVGPRGIPPDILARLEEALLTAIATPEMIRFLTNEGATPARVGAKDFQRLIASETARWADVARMAGITVG